MAWKLARHKSEVNGMLPVAQQVRMANQMLTKLFGRSGIGPGTTTGYIKLGALDFLLDGYPYKFPAADDCAIPSASANTTATQYRKVLVELPKETLAGMNDESDGVIGGSFDLATQSAVTVLGSGHIIYRINGKVYYADLDTTITLEDSGDVAQNKFGFWRIQIDGLGAVTAVDTGAQMAWATAEDAAVAMSAVAVVAGTTVLGYCSLTKSDGAFNIGTTDTDAANVTMVFYDVRQPEKVCSHLWKTPTAIAIVADAATVNVSALDAVIMGVKVTQIAVSATHAMDDADTIATLKYGAWVIFTDLAGTDTFIVAADGVPGSVSEMTYTTAALATAAAQLLIDQCPAPLIPVAVINVYNGAAGTFTAGTTKWDAASVVTTVTMVGEHFDGVSLNYGTVGTTQDAARLPEITADHIAVAVLEIPASFTTADAITAAMCKEMDMVDYAECYPRAG